MVAPWAWLRTTVASMPTTQSISVVSGPMIAPEPIRVPASREVLRRIWASGAIVTSAWIQVVCGSCTVTPESWAARTRRALSTRARSAS